jgi:brefeldin A-inhibited guanine nucleotide-exchange protein
MTSQTIEIHQRSVLQIIKTCFNIYLTSRSKINEATAQGCLSQMEQKMVKISFNEKLKISWKILLLGFIKRTSKTISRRINNKNLE